MSLYFAFRDLTNNVAQIPETATKTIGEQLVKLCSMHGEFPTSLKLLQELRALAFSDRLKSEQLASAICDDPLLSLRLISVVNSTLYSRGHDITSVLGAVNLVGINRIPDVATEVADAKNFRAIFLGRSVSALVFQEMVLSSILARRIVSILAPRQGLEGNAHILAVLSRLPLALLAFDKPNIYSALFLDHTRATPAGSLEKNFKKLVGKSTAEMGADLASALNLPKRIVTSIPLVQIAPWHKRTWAADEGRDVRAVVGAVHIANRLTTIISDFSGLRALNTLIEDMSSRINLPADKVGESLGEALSQLVQSLNHIGFTPMRLPLYVEKYTEPIVEPDGTINTRSIKWPGLHERINSFINELRACFKTRPDEGQFYRLPQAVLCTLRALLHGMNFDFAMFLRLDKNGGSLAPAVWLGEREPDLNLDEMVRRIIDPNSTYMPDLQAALQRKTVFTGDPIVPDCWPFVAFPAMALNDVQGVFFAHKNKRNEAQALDTQEQVAAIALAEEWFDVPVGFC